LSIERSPSIDPKKGVCVFGALGLLGGNGPKTPKPQTPFFVYIIGLNKLKI
jgi:hypothetical protein